MAAGDGGRGMTGTLYGLGIGPGDPELITLKAHRLLQRVPVIAYPMPAEGQSPTRAIAAPHIPAGRTEIAIRLTSANSTPRKTIEMDEFERIGRTLEDGHDVALLCEGDPLFYNDVQPLFLRLAEQFPIEVVPGVSSLSASAAALGTPLAAQDEQLLIIPASLAARTLTVRLSEADAAAVIELSGNFAKVRDCLAVTGLLPKSRYIERTAHGQQRVLPLDQVDPTQVSRASMILMHRSSPA